MIARLDAVSRTFDAHFNLKLVELFSQSISSIPESFQCYAIVAVIYIGLLKSVFESAVT